MHRPTPGPARARGWAAATLLVLLAAHACVRVGAGVFGWKDRSSKAKPAASAVASGSTHKPLAFAPGRNDSPTDELPEDMFAEGQKYYMDEQCVRLHV